MVGLNEWQVSLVEVLNEELTVNGMISIWSSRLAVSGSFKLLGTKLPW